MAKEIWVFAEQNNGEIAGVTAELLAKSQEIAGAMGGYTIAAVAASSDNSSAVKKLGAMGADKVYSLENDALADYRCDVFGAASVSTAWSLPLAVR